MLAPPPVLIPQRELEVLFHKLVKEWHDRTDVLSSSTSASMHPAYQRIIGLGPQVLPLLFKEMRDHGGHWFWALRAITGEDPVMPEMAGKIRLMQEIWLKWAKDRGFLGD